MILEPRKFSYESMGTGWSVTIWDQIDPRVFDEIKTEIIRRSQEFDQLYSRFIKTSLIWKLADMVGTVEIPADLMAMLKLYDKLYRLSDGKLNPLIGFTISDLGYDAEYSLKRKDTVRTPPPFTEALRILDDAHIELTEKVLIDVGALGKGFFVDKIASYLRERGIRKFLADGSGDVFYQGAGDPIRAGLEHPTDKSKVIGVLTFEKGGFCGSGTDRRRWEDLHHIIDPQSLTSPKQILSTWVLAESAALADGLATCLFLTEPERYQQEFRFEYLMVNDEYRVRKSEGMRVELF